MSAPLREHDEFALGAAEWPEDLSRRRFLQLMAASLALTGGACTRLPHDTILPYVRQPEALTPGQPLYFATAMDFGGFARGLLVRSHEGRPTKIEGNPDHPASRGRSGAHMQAELLTLYDPARSQTVIKSGQPDTWENLLGELLRETPRWKQNGGAGLRVLTRRLGSPTLRAQIARLLAKYPNARWHVHDAAFPEPPLPVRLHLECAEVVLSLDADLFGPGSANLENAAAFARLRRRESGPARWYVIESTPSLTGAVADHRRALSPRELSAWAASFSAALRQQAPPAEAWSAAVLRDLQQHRGRCLVVAGEYQPAAVHEAVQHMNEALGNIGQTIDYPAPETSDPAPANLAALAAAAERNDVEALIMLGGNSAYEAPVDLSIEAGLARIPFTLHLGLYPNETAQLSRWHVPESHFLEAWSDGRAFDGSESIAQPLIAPLYPSRSAHELLAALLEEVPSTGYEIIRAEWQRRHGEAGFEAFWAKTIHDGVATSLPAMSNKSLPPQPPPAAPKPAEETSTASLELLIRPDPHVLDGRYAENAWLQELPKPFTKLTWENAALLSPQTAAQNHLEHGDIAELHFHGRSIRAPVWVLPGQAEGCVTVHLGYGRTHAGAVGSGLGFNAGALQTTAAPYGGPGLELRKTGEHHRFSTTQSEQQMEGRDPVRVVKHGEHLPELPDREPPSPGETLYPAWKYEGAAWGMVIDLGTCIGCAACTIACQAENNIPVVGREQVLRRRAMHWIRVDRYFEDRGDETRVLHQPVTCMHCENAPCELVCPVGATVHDHEGLNVMVYNRCVGTRYCSNNCPYKVRRFNFLQYTDDRSPSLKLMRNPNVTVRMRGVMEKCTYCLQRISAARITADKESRAIHDGEVVPACAQACPADAIVFGDIHDPASRVASLRESPRHYALLAELNTRPRTTYLARLRNPNPELG